MKAKYKYVGNIDWNYKLVDYFTIGNVYEFEMDDDYFGATFNDHGDVVCEFFQDTSHGKWEKVE